MKCSAQRKCQYCKEFYLPDRRNLHHQRYCAEPACRRQSKAESQRRWAQKPENQNYFSGPQISQRVKEWRKRNPGYWRKATTGTRTSKIPSTARNCSISAGQHGRPNCCCASMAFVPVPKSITSSLRSTALTPVNTSPRSWL